MHYSNVFIDAFGYELPPNVVASRDLEERLSPLYQRLRLKKGQLEVITGIRERRFWDPGFKVSEGAAEAGRKALAASTASPADIGMLIYAGVCRDNLEPATACAVADALGIPPEAQVYDVSNACLGVLNGMIHIANAIELGQIRAGLVVSCETAREIVDITIDRLLKLQDMALFQGHHRHPHRRIGRRRGGADPRVPGAPGPPADRRHGPARRPVSPALPVGT